MYYLVTAERSRVTREAQLDFVNFFAKSTRLEYFVLTEVKNSNFPAKTGHEKNSAVRTRVRTHCTS